MTSDVVFFDNLGPKSREMEAGGGYAHPPFCSLDTRRIVQVRAILLRPTPRRGRSTVIDHE